MMMIIIIIIIITIMIITVIVIIVRIRIKTVQYSYNIYIYDYICVLLVVLYLMLFVYLHGCSTFSETPSLVSGLLTEQPGVSDIQALKEQINFLLLQDVFQSLTTSGSSRAFHVPRLLKHALGRLTIEPGKAS